MFLEVTALWRASTSSSVMQTRSRQEAWAQTGSPAQSRRPLSPPVLGTTRHVTGDASVVPETRDERLAEVRAETKARRRRAVGAAQGVGDREQAGRADTISSTGSRARASSSASQGSAATSTGPLSNPCTRWAQGADAGGEPHWAHRRGGRWRLAATSRPRPRTRIGDRRRLQHEHVSRLAAAPDAWVATSTRRRCRPRGGSARGRSPAGASTTSTSTSPASAGRASPATSRPAEGGRPRRSSGRAERQLGGGYESASISSAPARHQAWGLAVSTRPQSQNTPAVGRSDPPAADHRRSDLTRRAEGGLLHGQSHAGGGPRAAREGAPGGRVPPRTPGRAAGSPAGVGEPAGELHQNPAEFRVGAQSGRSARRLTGSGRGALRPAGHRAPHWTAAARWPSGQPSGCSHGHRPVHRESSCSIETRQPHPARRPADAVRRSSSPATPTTGPPVPRPLDRPHPHLSVPAAGS